ncbi:MAG: LL-diaminopimelate aminotransferase [Isosphaera sp.]|nr:LL-diaminopimelate aminotransferase [Isosphaera sp.]
MTAPAAITDTHTNPNPSAPKPTDLRAERLRALPPFLFNAIDDKKRAAIAAGKDVINLGVGDPDRPTPQFVIQAMRQALDQPANHQYPDCYGTKRFLGAAAAFMRRRFGVACDPARHMVACIGSKDGIGHLPLGLLNPGDGAVVFTPAYPVYAAGTVLAGATVHRVATSAATRWLPDFDDPATAHAAQRSRLVWLNFPGNPTGASADTALLDKAVRFCQRHGPVIASDLAYSEIYFDANGPASAPSLWQAPSARLDDTPAIEFHSLSKTFNMTGWRLGFAVGHPAVIAALKQTKDNYDSGPFNAIQDAGAVAMERFDDPAIAEMRREYTTRRDLVVAGLRRVGCVVEPPHAGIFVWARTPASRSTGRPMDSWQFVERAIEEAAVVMVPGAGFAETAHDFVRVSLTRQTDRIAQAMERLASVTW